MNYKNLKGRYFGNDVMSTKADNGMWTVTVVIRERVSEDGENWVEESIGASAMDMNFDTAHKLALGTVLSELNELVYVKGFESLVEAIEADRALEESKNDSNPKDNKDTFIQ